ncbi:MAG TPA: hypothetical protein DEG43_01100 [Acidimicrobiaceae bacterium]|jgi:heme exporter protein B|nr:hypothetical protein [Acidimicrobiaceae bacterium]
MREVLRAAVMVCRKDLRMEWRTKATISYVVPFVLIVVVLFAFALDTDPVLLRRATAGVYWITVLFAATLIAQRSAAIEGRDGVMDSLRLSGLDPAGQFLGKAAAIFAQLLLIQIPLGIGVAVLYGVSLERPGIGVLSALLATLAVAASGAIYGPLAAGFVGSEAVLPLLYLPVLTPVMMAATRSAESALGFGVGAGWHWTAMLGMLGATFLVLGTLTAASLLEHR